MQEQDVTGSDLTTYTLPVVDGDLKLSITNGGNAKSGRARVYIFEL